MLFLKTDVNADTTELSRSQREDCEGFKTIERQFTQLSQRVVTPAAIWCQSK